MRRRDLLAGGGLLALIGLGGTAWSRFPVIPKRPEPDLETAAGWISYKEGRFTLMLPRIEMGQNIATALKQVACAELGVDWKSVDMQLHDTGQKRVKATVGSESVKLFAEPLAQACAALRDALKEGQLTGNVPVHPRPIAELRAFRTGGHIGASPQIEQGLEIVTGLPLYAADIDRPEMLFGRVVRAPVSSEMSSRPLRWDVAAAEAVPGYFGVVEECGPPIGKARGLGIVASRPGALQAIADALAIEWAGPGNTKVPDIADIIDIDARAKEGKLPQVVLDGVPEDGTWDVDLRLDLAMEAHAPVETRAAVADWQGGRLEVWAGTQDAFYVRDVLAKAHGLASEAVVVHSCRVGGGFGGRTICTVEAEAAALSREVGRPVKVQWTRGQEFSLGFHRPPSSHRVRARLGGGRITDWSHLQVSSHILFTPAAMPAWMQMAADAVAGDAGVARGMAAPYILGRASARCDAIRLPVHTGPWRGLGAGPNVLAIESAIDEAAYAAGTDPLAFRLAHIEDARLKGVLERVAEIADWGRPVGAATPGQRLGRGLACGIYKSHSYAAAVADVSVDGSGEVKVTRMWCTHDCGLVFNPDQVKAQCEGNMVWGIGMVLMGMLPIEHGRVSAESFFDAPIPRISDVPEIVVELVHTDNYPAGAGETAIVAGPGAIANAVRAATGIRPTRFPIGRLELSV